MHTGLYNRNRKGRNNNFVDPAELLDEGLCELELEERLGGDELLMEYVTELMNWNRVYNLTSVRKPTDIVTRHILDSLTILPHLNGERILDIGTGAGLPGIPLAIACPERDFVLLDSSSKKLRFVQQTLGILKLDNVTLAEVECLADKTVIDEVVTLKVPGLDAERHLVIMHAAEST